MHRSPTIRQSKASAPCAADEVAILLALLNGAATLEAQLDSFAAQTHRNWRLVVSDDGSTDDGPARLRGWAARQPGRDVRLVAGPRMGFVANFLRLIGLVGPETPYAALSDQDDVWLPDRLARGVAALAQGDAARPAIWTCRTVICDAALRPRRLSPACARGPSFANALVQNIAWGNTILLNRAAIDLVQAAIADGVRGRIEAHDWWIYQLVTGVGGRVVWDPEPQVLYRQHPGNHLGANDGPAGRWRRLLHLLARGGLAQRSAATIAALRASAHRLTPENRRRLMAFVAARRKAAPLRRIGALRAAGLHHQSPVGTAILFACAAFGRL